MTSNTFGDRKICKQNKGVLTESEIQSLKEENERLKGLIEKAYDSNGTFGNQTWGDFKKENNIE